MTGRFVVSFLEAGVRHVSERITPCGTCFYTQKLLSMFSNLYSIRLYLDYK